MPTNSSAKSRRFSVRRRRRLALAALAALAAAGCRGYVVPVFVPIRTLHVKPGPRRCQTLVVLPNRALATLYLHYHFLGGRVAFTQLGLINHRPDKVQMLFLKTLAYVDDGPPLRVRAFRNFDPKKSKRDALLLEPVLAGLPNGAPAPTAKWLFVEQRYVTPRTLRGPTVVLRYRVNGHDGFLKIRYRTLWDMPD